MNQNGRDGKKNKTQLIAFRVDDDAFSEIENRAILAGKTTNDWCRDELLARLGEGPMLTANEELIYAEVVRFGNVLTAFLNALAKNELTPEISKKLLTILNMDGRKLAKHYFSRITERAQETGTDNSL
jgi:hypothetical protein